MFNDVHGDQDAECAMCVDDDSRESHTAFDTAIRDGRLVPNQCNSSGEEEPLYAGAYMYMGRHGGKDLFKHIDTRQYID